MTVELIEETLRAARGAILQRSPARLREMAAGEQVLVHDDDLGQDRDAAGLYTDRPDRDGSRLRGPSVCRHVDPAKGRNQATGAPSRKQAADAEC